MDIANLDLNARGNEGVWIDIVGPAGQETGLRIRVSGQHSDRMRAATEASDRRLKEAIEAKRTSDADLEKLTKQRDAEIMTTAVMAWQTVARQEQEDGTVNTTTDDTLLFNGAKLPCTPENARMIMQHPGLDWLAAQVLNASRNARLFTMP